MNLGSSVSTAPAPTLTLGQVATTAAAPGAAPAFQLSQTSTSSTASSLSFGAAQPPATTAAQPTLNFGAPSTAAPITGSIFI